MRSFLAIALALVSLLSTTEAWTLQGMCHGAETRCACCAEAQDCGCSGNSEKVPTQMPAPLSVRHELSACSCALLPVSGLALVQRPVMKVPKVNAAERASHDAPQVPVFILHCSALC